MFSTNFSIFELCEMNATQRHRKYFTVGGGEALKFQLKIQGGNQNELKIMEGTNLLSQNKRGSFCSSLKFLQKIFSKKS